MKRTKTQEPRRDYKRHTLTENPNTGHAYRDIAGRNEHIGREIPVLLT